MHQITCALPAKETPIKAEWNDFNNPNVFKIRMGLVQKVRIIALNKGRRHFYRQSLIV